MISIQEYRDTGIQGYRDTGIQGYRDTGIQGYRDTGIQGYRNTDKIFPNPALAGRVRRNAADRIKREVLINMSSRGITRGHVRGSNELKGDHVITRAYRSQESADTEGPPSHPQQSHTRP